MITKRSCTCKFIMKWRFRLADPVLGKYFKETDTKNEHLA